jgi:hypothetical protein
VWLSLAARLVMVLGLVSGWSDWGVMSGWSVSLGWGLMSGLAESVVINGGFQMPCLYSLSKSSLVHLQEYVLVCLHELSIDSQPPVWRQTPCPSAAQ